MDTDGFALKLAVAGGHVYLADGSAGPSGYGTMRVIDVADPAAPFEAGFVPVHGFLLPVRLVPGRGG